MCESYYIILCIICIIIKRLGIGFVSPLNFDLCADNYIIRMIYELWQLDIYIDDFFFLLIIKAVELRQFHGYWRVSEWNNVPGGFRFDAFLRQTYNYRILYVPWVLSLLLFIKGNYKIIINQKHFRHICVKQWLIHV